MKIAREGWPLVALALLPTPLAWWIHPWAAAPFLLAGVFTLWFFRDPERDTPEDPAALICPADGKIIRNDPGKISIFMNVFNVHVCRTPAGGTVEGVVHTPGRFLSAFRDAASEHNERTRLVIAGDEGRLAFTLVAGLIARRIVCRVRPGQQLKAGERIGLIRFGSRVDVELPEGAKSEVRLGQRVRAGESVLGRLAGQPATSRDFLYTEQNVPSKDDALTG